ncbi:hypothetical protein TNCV_2341761 [Trichonephila clavipes]|uniref:Uncharacterized protein n=1 Tax=Trichonephila clavipes TaxID=2585209 RepID=A0A8X6R5B6_TRICX|nr:hypothetical protein TNCV_2341761 [Trichonephila clavipes]
MQISHKEQDRSLGALRIYCRENNPYNTNSQQNSQNKHQKVFTPSTVPRHKYQCLKYKYVKNYSQAPLVLLKSPANRLSLVVSLTVKARLLIVSQSYTDSVSASVFLFICLADPTRKIRLRQRSGNWCISPLISRLIHRVTNLP